MTYPYYTPQYIEDEANRLNEKTRFAIPVDVEKVAKANGIALTIEEDDLEEGVSGRIVLGNNRACISLNRTHHPNRKRFTAAHELGHFILHKERSRIFVDGSPYGSLLFYRDQLAAAGVDQIEIEANNFAASLLMPKNKLVYEFSKLAFIFDEDGDLALRNLASKFGVSVHALTIRLAKLGLIPQELISL
jgi:Zn-dependent peptidase ImmA (M78 family)